MEPDLSIQIVWPLAAHEAISANFEFIEPSHLFLALLKFAELEERHLNKIIADAKETGQILSQRNQIRSKLADYSIRAPDSCKSIRYNLRKRLGRGRHQHDGKSVIHRSESARDIFKIAIVAAQKDGVRQWSAIYLLEALFKHPAREIKDVLVNAGISVFVKSVPTPYLNKYGRDLKTWAMGKRTHGLEKNVADVAKDPVCKVVVDYIQGSEKLNILLIKKGERTPGEIMESIARYSATDSAPPGIKSKQIIEIDIDTFSRKKWQNESKEPEDDMRALFQEVVEAGDIILFISDFYGFLDTDGNTGFSDLLKELLLEHNIMFIGGADHETHDKMVIKDPEWKKILRPVWMHDLKMPFQV